MNRTKRGQAAGRLTVATAFAVIVGATGALAMLDTRPEKAQAEAWAAKKAVLGQLPLTVDEFSELPLTYRRAAFLQMTPAQRSAIWQEQFARVASRPDLTREQRDLVLEYRTLLRPEVYDLSNPERERFADATKQYCSKIVELFTLEQRWALKNIGAPPPHQLRTLRTLASSLQRILGVAPVNAGGTEDCRCNSGLGACDCNIGQKCKVLSCTEIVLGCGCGGDAVNCDRLCQLPAN